VFSKTYRPVAASQDLHRLIRSLSKAEKGYFKKFGLKQSGSGSVYLRLFDAIDGMAEYDEAWLQQRFRGEKLTRQFSKAKNYLRQLILQSLRAFHDGQTIESQIQENLDFAHLLREKNLFAQSLKHLDKADKLARAHDKFEYRLRIIFQKLKFDRFYFKGSLHEQNKRLTAERKRVLDQLAHYVQYHNLIRELVVRVNVQSDVFRSDLAELQALLEHPLMAGEGRAQSFLAKRLYFEIQRIYFTLHKDWPKTYAALKRLVQLHAHNPAFVQHHLTAHLYTLQCLLIACENLGKMEEAMEVIAQIRALPCRSQREKHFAFTTRIFELNLLCNQQAFDRAVALADELEPELEVHKPNLSEMEVTHFYHQFVRSYFGARQFNRALTYNNRILNELQLTQRADLQCVARIVDLLLHYELGHVDLLEYRLKSTYRFLKKRERLFRSEAILLKFIRHLPGIPPSRKALQQAFAQLHQALQEVKDQPQERNFFKDFDILGWLGRKTVL